MRIFFKATLKSFIEVQNVFQIINFDVPDLLGPVGNIFDTLRSQNQFSIAGFSAKLADFGVFKAFINNFFYCSLYQEN